MGFAEPGEGCVPNRRTRLTTSHPAEESGKSEQRNGFGFGSVGAVGDSGRNGLSGVAGRGAPWGEGKNEEEVEQRREQLPRKVFVGGGRRQVAATMKWGHESVWSLYLKIKEQRRAPESETHETPEP